jgi:hypothetical protein
MSHPLIKNDGEKMKSIRFFQDNLKTLVIALRFAIQYETEFIACHSHMKDEESKKTVKESQKLIKKFMVLKKKIQTFLLENKNENS